MTNQRLKVQTIFGTRPEAIKLAPVITELNKHRDIIDSQVVVTAQHRQMLDQVLELFGIKPDIDLDIMEHDQTLSKITTSVLKKLEDVMQDYKPDLVLVQGDTTTAFVTALAAYYHHVKVGHIEAGLRSDDRYHPFPEEINRRMISCLADLHFVPTEGSFRNLLKEGIGRDSIFSTGNTAVDSLLYITRKRYAFTERILKRLDFKKDKIILVTAHRRESLGRPLENICHAIKHLARVNPDTQIVFPVHLNPAVRRTVGKIITNESRVHLIEPLDYQSLAHLLKHCYLVLTDSGGIQEEAPTFGKPVLVLRDVTERPEGIKVGVAKLVGTSQDKIIRAAQKLIDSSTEYDRMAKKGNPYGDGRAAARIVKIIMAQELARR